MIFGFCICAAPLVLPCTAAFAAISGTILSCIPGLVSLICLALYLMRCFRSQKAKPPPYPLLPRRLYGWYVAHGHRCHAAQHHRRPLWNAGLNHCSSMPRMTLTVSVSSVQQEVQQEGPTTAGMHTVDRAYKLPR